MQSKEQLNWLSDAKFPVILSGAVIIGDAIEDCKKIAEN